VRITKIAGTAPYKNVRLLQKFFQRDAGLLRSGLQASWKGDGLLPGGWEGDGLLPGGWKGDGLLPGGWKGDGVLPGGWKGDGVQQVEPGGGKASAGEVGANFQALCAGPEHGQGTIQAGAANF